ncbi:hypothetical protein C8R42DRAFT_590052 [Lentinula raphanica]|nr:hypothetical protein C8R42DRAFT_590052 [Lentinula raphanica]
MHALRYPQDAEGVQWFKDAFDFLNIDLGVTYTAFVNLYIEFERVSGWQTSRIGLPRLNRPDELNDWISYGRYSKKKIVIPPEKVGDFASRFMEWWTSLQPEWRQQVAGEKRLSPLSEVIDDWRSLDYCGKNGWLNFLAGIRWWGESVVRMEEPERSEHANKWLAAIDDMSSMLTGLILVKQKLSSRS